MLYYSNRDDAGKNFHFKYNLVLFPTFHLV
jgi:hypothetical protein